MVFSSPIFLFLFLPIVLTLYPLFPGEKWKNTWLLFVSVIFYAWGEATFVFLMLGSVMMNYGLGLWVDAETDARRRKWAVGASVFLNVGLLAFFKYADFVVINLNAALRVMNAGPIHPPSVRLPIGISFFTFHAISYIMDIYRRKSRASRSPRDVALYIFFFPQLIAGPILRWSAMAPQFAHRQVRLAGFVEGVRRFAGGLGKKMLIANSLAVPADQIFSLPSSELSPAVSWFGTLCYTLQIYFDFSGYSDMAVGLGKMFGFEFIENFNYPYISQSIKEFWRRWHISLSTWFRDYVYFPLGGNRCSTRRTYLNLVIVFFLCGLWHGASWTFVVWGLYHGIFLALERTRLGDWIDRLPSVFRHLYTLFVVMVGWVLFRADDFPKATSMLCSMFGLAPHSNLASTLARFCTNEVKWALAAGILFSMPALPWCRQQWNQFSQKRPFTGMVELVFEPAVLLVILIFSAAWLASGTYNPFIYFRF